MWRSTERASLEKKPSMRLSQEPCLIPIVMVNAEDPVAQGIVGSLARPGANITGLVQGISADLAGKRLQLTVPRISRVALLVQPNLPGANAEWAVLELAAKSLGLTLHPIQARQGNEVGNALVNMMEGRPDSLFVVNKLSALFTEKQSLISQRPTVCHLCIPFPKPLKKAG